MALSRACPETDCPRVPLSPDIVFNPRPLQSTIPCRDSKEAQTQNKMHSAVCVCASDVSPESHLQPSSSSRRPPHTPELLSLAAVVPPRLSADRRIVPQLLFYLSAAAFLLHFLILFTEPRPEQTGAHLHLYGTMDCIETKTPKQQGEFLRPAQSEGANTIPVASPAPQGPASSCAAQIAALFSPL